MSTKVQGGCLCGHVRYEAVLTSTEAHYCHCRMCQQASGNIFQLFVGAEKASLRWSHEPTLYASSKQAVRGFCSRCGTPLSFAYHGMNDIGLTVGSLDHPEYTHPVEHCGIESRIASFLWKDDLPQSVTSEDVTY